MSLSRGARTNGGGTNGGGIIDRSHMFHRLRVSGDRLCTLIDEKFKNSAVTAHVELVTRVPEQTIGRRAALRVPVSPCFRRIKCVHGAVSKVSAGVSSGNRITVIFSKDKHGVVVSSGSGIIQLPFGTLFG